MEFRRYPVLESQSTFYLQAPLVAVPQFEFRTLPHQHDVFFQLGKVPQRRRDQHAACPVHVDVHRKTDEASLQFAHA